MRYPEQRVPCCYLNPDTTCACLQWDLFVLQQQRFKLLRRCRLSAAAAAIACLAAAALRALPLPSTRCRQETCFSTGHVRLGTLYCVASLAALCTPPSACHSH